MDSAEDSVVAAVAEEAEAAAPVAVAVMEAVVVLDPVVD